MTDEIDRNEEIIEEEPTKDELEEATDGGGEAELPAEVDAFLKGKRKYKHPYGNWRPVVKSEPLKRKTFGEQLDLPADNWHLPENQPVEVIPVTIDQPVKLIFKEREIAESKPTSSSKASESVTFKKRKIVTNRQIRGDEKKDIRPKRETEED